MGAARFYLHCRSQGIKITMDDAVYMRDSWIRAFPEMKLHMNPEKATDTGILNRNLFGFHAAWTPTDDEDEYDDDYEEVANGKDDAFGYRAVLPCGQIRNRCSYNAAANAMFQGTTAVGVKVAGWNLIRSGYGERLSNMIHDEYIYNLYPDELLVHIPVIERIMIQGMKTVIPDVKVSVETTCMFHWDKETVVKFADLKFTPDGAPIIDEPPYVQNILNNKETCNA